MNKTDEGFYNLSKDKLNPFVVSLSNHERPFDRLRANRRNTVFQGKLGAV